MRLFAFAALLALPLAGLVASAAKADDYCCRGSGYPHDEFVTKAYYVYKHATLFGCDGYHCETNIRLDADLHIKARCRNGWCEIRSLPLKDAWVLESCLKHGYGGDNGYRKYPKYGHGDDNGHDDGEPDYGRRY